MVVVDRGHLMTFEQRKLNMNFISSSSNNLLASDVVIVSLRNPIESCLEMLLPYKVNNVHFGIIIFLLRKSIFQCKITFSVHVCYFEKV